MFIADYHTHCNFSSDSETPMEDMIIKAIELGLKEIALTDHVDLDYPNYELDFSIDYNDYNKVFYNLKEKYKDKIKLLLGIEIGLQPHLKQRLVDIYNSVDFDFVIASTHVVDRLDLYNGDFYKNKSKEEAYQLYFEDVLNNIHIHNNFNVYGHLDYIIRYGDFENKALDYNDYKDIIDEILKALIDKGKGIEINTSGYRYKLNQTHPQIEVLKRYKELKGEIITVGSDAHKPQDIAAYFDVAYSLLKQVGFKYITLFEKCNPKFISI